MQRFSPDGRGAGDQLQDAGVKCVYRIRGGSRQRRVRGAGVCRHEPGGEVSRGEKAVAVALHTRIMQHDQPQERSLPIRVWTDNRMMRIKKKGIN